MRIAVICATHGRPAEATDLSKDMTRQTRRPDRVIFVVTGAENAPPPSPDHEVMISPRQGSCAQRNVGLEAVQDYDIVVYFDDDFVPDPRWLERLEKLMTENPDVAGVTGKVVLDGIKGPGLRRDEALAAITAEIARFPDGDPACEDRINLYGCNMAIRLSASDGRRFDEMLPLYGWLEDVDYTAPLRDKGRLIRAGSLVGAHLGVKRGRTAGKRFGYSQIANPVYLMRKGSFSRLRMLDNLMSNTAANLIKSFRPEPYIDRRGRLRGNLTAFLDILLRRNNPRRILDL